ncbi:DEAD/DEAH box helicase (plasmid) [Fulvitalea axinellae]|uniref:Type I restriction enzyme endonuclease subunit n=1 Tax=Fulvitalea axinellae TaxID=1182444 RepID=A0AAU9D6V2_9BACT|nr:DEAD/DEAH box helicase [Fulvitalea axinellae]
MSYEYSEDGLVEQATEDVLRELGWEVKSAWKKESFGEEGLLGREDRSEVVLTRHLRKALEKLNPGLPEKAYRQAEERLTRKESGKSLGAINKDKYELLRKGVPVSFTNDEGELVKTRLRVFDFGDYGNNHFLAVRQFEVQGELYLRRPDIVGFVNGLPLALFELKAHDTALRQAYSGNLKDYKDTIPELFHANAFIILSNGTESRVGTLTSPYKYFLEWKRISEEEEGKVSLDTMLRGTCAPERFMDIFENFLLFDSSKGEVSKLMAKNHQYLGVNRVLENIRRIEDLEGNLGVYWHTQGSGKSYSMVFLCEKAHRKLGGGYTFLIAVDRSELENQIYETFSGVGAVNDPKLVAGKKKGMTGRAHLRELLRENHRYVFTLIHKFSVDDKTETEYPLLTERKNVIVISDEAHRTQGGIYAGNMRFRALPNASFIGFTGTPIIQEERELTRKIFGDYVSVYDFKRAVDDQATLPLRYLNRGEKLDIENPALDERMAEILEDENLDEDKRKKLTHMFQRQYPVLTAESRLNDIAKDLVWHFNERGYQGKAMLVTLDKPTAVRMHGLIVKHWPDYVEELREKLDKCQDKGERKKLEEALGRAEKTEVCVVVSNEQNEVDKFRKLGLEIAPHRRKMVERNLEKEFKDEDNPFRLAIVCSMWITGFDAQCVSTMYLDKPIKGHTLMQTIARANRVYDEDKENGLIIDYGNVYKQLEKAYSVYGEGGRSGEGHPPGPPPEPLSELEEELKQAIRDTRNYLKELGFRLADLYNAKPMERLRIIGEAVEAVCLNRQSRATFEFMARNVFRKYKALFPEEEAKAHSKAHHAIEAIYGALNQKTASADVSDIIRELQEVVDDSVTTQSSGVRETGNAYVDLSRLDFDKLRKAFVKTPRKKRFTYDLQEAVERKLEHMLRENPLRVSFYERYKKIIREYNEGKDLENTQRSFDKLHEFIKDLHLEEQRAVREQVGDQEVLAVFDLLLEGKELNAEERNKVKEVASKTLDILKGEKLKIDRWRESREAKAKVKSSIYDQLLWLPERSYTDEDVSLKAMAVYQHVYSSYHGGGRSVYV